MNYRNLKLKRIDLWPMSDAVAYHVVKRSGDDPTNMLKKVYGFSELSIGGYYIAANLKTSDEIINKIGKNLQDFKNTPEYRMILKKWGM